MAHILLVEDDADQRVLRKLILEKNGHTVVSAGSPSEALQAMQRTLGGAKEQPACVLMDLRLPKSEDGLKLIRDLKKLLPDLPVVVLSGWLDELLQSPEASQVSATLTKPVRPERLLKTISKLALFALGMINAVTPLLAQTREFAFDVKQSAEVVAEVRMSSPGGDWAQRGREAPLAVLTLDGKQKQHLMVYGGPKERAYSVFLGRLEPGKHTLRVERDATYSAAGAGLAVGNARFEALSDGDVRAQAVAQAPVLYARANTVGGFSDVPMLVYYTKGSDADGPWLEYTVIFSNEDGGTSTRDLMARWGRTTDIEYVYRVWLNPQGGPAKTLIQTREHQDVPYEGKREGTHPVLIPVTDNNMVEPAGEATPPIRYQLAPVAADLSKGSREIVMDADPITYLVAAKELQREGKLRPAGMFDGEKVGDPRLYLVAELKVASKNAAVQVLVRRKQGGPWKGSAVGIGKDFIERSGWVRTALELPPGTRLDDIVEVGVECLSRRDLEKQPLPKIGSCQVEATGRVFFLNSDYEPGPDVRLPALPPGGWKLQTGEMNTLLPQQ